MAYLQPDSTSVPINGDDISTFGDVTQPAAENAVVTCNSAKVDKARLTPCFHPTTRQSVSALAEALPLVSQGSAPPQNFYSCQTAEQHPAQPTVVAPIGISDPPAVGINPKHLAEWVEDSVPIQVYRRHKRIGRLIDRFPDCPRPVSGRVDQHLSRAEEMEAAFWAFTVTEGGRY